MAGFPRNAKPFREIPKVPSLPVIGSSWIYSRLLGNGHPDERHKVSMELHRKYGPIFVEKLPGRYSVVHLSRAADIKNLYQEEGKEPVRIGATPFKRYRESRPQYYSDAGLLNLQGNEWQKVRSTTQPYALKINTTRSYVPIMNRVCEEALDLIEQVKDDQGEVKDCFSVLRRWALESIVLSSVDARLGALKHPLDPTSDGAAILNDMETIFACMQKFCYRFPYFHYFRTPTWSHFERAMDNFTV
ncbi:probable cytochrome P450 49a1 [Rhipicephalus sanguineus]|uniref:probable cytochrome P450 49a1 n=1 Tax=Rhipicephalus sanguineus TaxID=34632 RepID=UPI00189302EE|nr:probable cytochrome P450 49a1 [Rhipicephalus sanguineus]